MCLRYFLSYVIISKRCIRMNGCIFCIFRFGCNPGENEESKRRTKARRRPIEQRPREAVPDQPLAQAHSRRRQRAVLGAAGQFPAQQQASSPVFSSDRVFSKSARALEKRPCVSADQISRRTRWTNFRIF